MEKTLKRPKPGEIVETRFGPAKVVTLRLWDEIEEDEFNSEEGKRDFVYRVEHFLGNVDEYFEYVVRYLDNGECDMYDWSEYEG